MKNQFTELLSILNRSMDKTRLVESIICHICLLLVVFKAVFHGLFLAHSESYIIRKLPVELFCENCIRKFKIMVPTNMIRRYMFLISSLIEFQPI